MTAAAQFVWERKAARENQTEPKGDWNTWLILAGRGFGKTRTGAEWLAAKAADKKCRLAVVAPTIADARDTCVEGESGLLSVLSRYRIIESWNRSQGALRLKNGSLIRCYSGEEPERLRGPQHHYAWVDEFAAFRYPREAWDQLRFGLRLGEHPRTVVTTTPKPIPIVKDFLARDDGTVTITRGSTFDNRDNLPDEVLNEFIKRYEGTRIGRQELYGEVLQDVEGALFTYAMLEATRVSELPETPHQVVVAIDPAVTSGATSDETGIITAARIGDHFYITADNTLRDTPDGWARAAVAEFHRSEANTIVAEVNQGGDLIKQVIATVDPNVPVRKISATRGKYLRAEPVAALWEQGRVHLVGVFPVLEEEMATWTPADLKSPDRLDALVHAVTFLNERVTKPVQTFRT